MDMVIAQTFEKGTPVDDTIGATAGNVATSFSPGVGRYKKFLYGRITLVCDGTVADRYPQLDITTAAGVVKCRIGAGNKAVATQTKNMSFGQMNNYGSSNISMDDFHLCWGEGVYVYGTDIFKISIVGGVAGDSYSGKIFYLYGRINP